jgi:glycosyltransferase involved in cell wall biosynthesis
MAGVIEEIVHPLGAVRPRTGEARRAAVGPQAPPRRVSLVVPAFNEASAIGRVVEAFRTLPAVGEVLVVDDGSSDDTAAQAATTGARVLRHPFNRGYGAALKTGIRAAREEYVVFADGDGQHTPADVQKIIGHLSEADMVVGARLPCAGSPWRRRPGKMLVAWLVRWLSRHPIPDVNSGLRGGRRKLFLSILPLMPNSFSFSTTSTLAVLHEGRFIHYEPIDVRERDGTSSVSIIRDGVSTVLLVTRLISLFAPLRVFVPMAVLLGLAGLASFIHDAVGYMNITDTTVILLIVSIMIFFFGLLADQVAAIRRELVRGDDA